VALSRAMSGPPPLTPTGGPPPRSPPRTPSNAPPPDPAGKSRVTITADASGDESAGDEKAAKKSISPSKLQARKSLVPNRKAGGSKRQKQRLKEKRKSMNAEAREEERLELLARQVIGADEDQQKPLVDRTKFSTFMGVIIMANAITVGIETEQVEEQLWMGITNNFFVLVYIFEFTARFYYHGSEYFYEPFNVFDFFLVVIAVLDAWVITGDQMGSFSALKLVRMLRLVRLVRLVRFFKELYLVVVGLVSTLKTLLWVAILLFLIMWVCAIFMTLVLGKSQAWMFVDRAGSRPFEYFDVREYFSTVSRSTFSLFQIVTLDTWASQIMRPVMEVYPIMIIFFIFLVFLGAFGLMNIIVGVIVRDALVQSKKNKAAETRMKEIAQQKATIQIRRFFREVDLNGDGMLDMGELEAAIENPKARRFFHEIDLDISSATKVFRCMDIDGDGELSSEEFVNGYLSASAKSADLVKVGLELSALISRTVYFEERMLQLKNDVQLVKTSMQSTFDALERQHWLRYEQENPMRQYWELKAEIEAELRKPPPPPPPPHKTVDVKLRAAAARWKGDLSDPVQVLLKAWDERAPLTKVLKAPPGRIRHNRQQVRHITDKPLMGRGILGPKIPPPPLSVPEPEPEDIEENSRPGSQESALRMFRGLPDPGHFPRGPGSIESGEDGDAQSDASYLDPVASPRPRGFFGRLRQLASAVRFPLRGRRRPLADAAGLDG
jgi:voltage-gated sodium channel